MSLIAQANDVFGRIEPPEPIQNTYGVLGDGNAGITGFISDIIVFVTIVGGLWFLINVLIGGFQLIISEGDSKKLADFGGRLSMMVIGLILMVGAPLIAAIIGFLVFGDSTALLNPSIVGIGR